MKRTQCKACFILSNNIKTRIAVPHTCGKEQTSMKIKDIEPSSSLLNRQVKTPNGKTAFIAGIWQKGVWLKPDLQSTRVEPHFLEDIKELLEWELVQ